MIPFQKRPDITERQIEEELDWAWAAGIIDGEGCISVGKKTHKPGNTGYSLLLRCKMTHLPTIEKLRTIFKIGTIYHQTAKPNWKEVHLLQVNGIFVSEICLRMKPYLITKQEQAVLAIEYSNKCILPPGNVKEVESSIHILRSVIFDEFTRLNRRGKS